MNSLSLCRVQLFCVKVCFLSSHPSAAVQHVFTAPPSNAPTAARNSDPPPPPPPPTPPPPGSLHHFLLAEQKDHTALASRGTKVPERLFTVYKVMDEQKNKRET